MKCLWGEMYRGDMSCNQTKQADRISISQVKTETLSDDRAKNHLEAPAIYNRDLKIAKPNWNWELFSSGNELFH